jgi:uncharacterized protein
MTESALQFPCDVPVKMFGRNVGEFRVTALALIRAHFSGVAESDLVERLSREGTYLSLTVTVRAESREQIDALYRELSTHDSVMMAL